ncbi:hypothetical protein [Niallia endozanthoxylica]|uniref:Uncharacterized protein n=1 Tax=Niallia endozanthoxylica TaxID=2036016 RepID=A0A5J5HR69_9BACI|nr:hypothetical protein [Niallia endozanthoxylica]KAA9023978.1 hypothetical protein F4V44_12675 [Niallia endozanthoxylica]
MNDDKEKSNVGYTIFKPTGVRHEFPYVDLVKQQVIGTVSYKGKIHMKVIVDVKANTIQVEEDVVELGDLSMDRDSYIDMFKHQARFFIDNHISNPKKYYEDLINN